MKAELTKITDRMSQDELIKAITDNFESLNQLQHDREIAIFGRYNELSSKVDGIKNLLDNVHGEMKSGFNNTNGQINALDTKINQVNSQLSSKIDLISSKLDKILDNLSDKKLLTEED